VSETPEPSDIFVLIETCVESVAKNQFVEKHLYYREFRVALPWELLHADDLVVIAESEDDLIKRLNEWKDFVVNKGMRVNINKTKVMIIRE